MVEPIQGEGGVRAPPDGLPAGAARRSATSSACCSSMTRCSAAWAAPASCSRMNGRASRPTSWRSPRRSGTASRSAPASPPSRPRSAWSPGTHGSTFGGNPLAVGGRQRRARRRCSSRASSSASTAHGQAAAGQLETLVASYPKLFAELRGSGLLLGIRCSRARPAISSPSCAQNGLLDLTAGDNVLRILPPLIVGEREIDEALDIMNKVAREWPA